jgi:hypothetical protein
VIREVHYYHEYINIGHHRLHLVREGHVLQAGSLLHIDGKLQLLAAAS